MQILLIEDDEDAAKFVVAGLTEAGHGVVHADNGQEGLNLAESGHFDVMIFDRQLPNGVDGANILQTLRAHAVQAPVLFLSGLGELHDWMRGLEAGGDDYIVKPFNFADLLARVETLHETAQARKNAVN